MKNSIDRFLGLFFRLFSLSVFATILSVSSSQAQDTDDVPKEPSVPSEWFGEGVRPTEPLTAQEELQSFHVPKGFVVELVAHEPQIAKPMNLAFDNRGRLWVTQSVEYPYQAKEGEVARDEVRILEDLDGDGYREKVTVFAGGLNVPIGLLPFGDGCLCFSIPNILYLRDTDGDMRCDQRQVILGPFDTTRDTHGMVNSLRMGLDGWIYANHGFNNQSKVAGQDGHTVALISGNVFRFRPDGSRVELYTQGQVNPFGSDEDEFGTYFTADCHSKPISQLVRGGCYPSFGRPDDGLGFVPSTMEHLHGSTAIAGIAIGKGSGFPSSFQENFFSGNVMTSRINRNRIDRLGATVRAVELPDLLTSDDPWFRPVDLRFGPDGALYVADFYNKIIGHYEVPLQHPGRDRFRGRIFRIRYVGVSKQESLVPNNRQGDKKSGELSIATLESRLSSPNPWVRRDALTELVDKNSHRIESDFTKVLHDRRAESSWIRIGLLWGHVQAFQRLPKGWQVMANAGSSLERTHLAMAIGSIKNFEDVGILRSWIRQAPADAPQSVARRAAIEAIGFHGNDFDVDTLIDISLAEPEKDPITAQSAKIACRQLLRRSEVSGRKIAKWEATKPASESVSQMRIALLLSLGDDLAFEPMLRWVARQDLKSSTTKSLLSSLAKATPLESTESVIGLLDQTFIDDPRELGARLVDMATAQQKKYGRYAPILDDRTFRIASALLREESQRVEPSSIPVRSWFEAQGKSWPIETRKLESSGEQAVLSSFGLGEAYTGQFESESFTAPEKISFCIVGHNGPPDQADHQKNRVQLVLVSNGQVVREAFPPRSDLGRSVEWELQDLNGQAVFLRCIDGDSGNAYAWIAIGRISVGGLDRSPFSDGLLQFTSIGQMFDWGQYRDELAGLVDAKWMSAGWRLRMASVVQRRENPLLNSLLQFIAARGWGQRLVDNGAIDEKQLWNAGPWNSDAFVKLAEALCVLGSSKDQRELVKTLGGRRDRLDVLVRCVESGKLGRDALTVLDKAWWDALEGHELGERLAQLRPDESANQIAMIQQVEERVRNIGGLVSQIENGTVLFKEKCSLCHQIGGQGTVLGPQLEGVGGRGTQRLAEDVLLPNQNVDEAFRMTTFLTSDGQVVSGLIRERKEDSLVIANQKGESITIAKDDIEEEKPSTLSLMPGNFSELLTDQQMADLLGYLRSQAKKDPSN